MSQPPPRLQPDAAGVPPSQCLCFSRFRAKKEQLEGVKDLDPKARILPWSMPDSRQGKKPVLAKARIWP